MNPDNLEIENSKILRSIWKNTFDKILEIKVSNKRELAEKKTKIVIEDKKAIDAKYTKRYNDEFIDRKIELSKEKNSENMKIMNAKRDHVDSIMKETLKRLKAFANPENPKYQKLLKDLIIESMVKMLETECYIQVRKGDMAVVNRMSKDCEATFESFMKKETERDYSCKINIEEGDPTLIEYGGVRMLSKDKKIILNNDLQSRLTLSKESNLPTIKAMLFPKEKKL